MHFPAKITHCAVVFFFLKQCSFDLLIDGSVFFIIFEFSRALILAAKLKL